MIRDRYPMFYKGHPKLYFKRKPIFWWATKWKHFRFILRELTSLGVAYFSICLILLVRAISIGPDSYQFFLRWFSSPLGIIIDIAAVGLLLFHSITWFQLAPKAMVIRIGKTTIPGSLIVGANFGAWIVFSGIVIWFLITG